MSRVRSFPPFLALTGLVLFGGQAASEQPGQQPPTDAAQRQPVFRAGVNLVRVDVTVTDRDGAPVLDLTEADFEILEDDRPQTIESLELLRRDGERAPGDDLSLEIRSLEHGRAEAAREDVRLFAIFLDDYHVRRGPDTLIVRRALTRFVREQLGTTDLVALMDPLTPLSALTFSRDRYELARLIEAFEGRYGIYFPARSVLEEQQSLSRDVRRVRVEVTLSALESLVTHLGSLREGRKAVIFVSQGFAVPYDLMSRLVEVYEAANRANAAIYPLDPRGLGADGIGGAHDTLRTLADNSGGRALVNYNQFDRPLAQVVRDASAYYLIGYVSSQAPLDGKFHEIAVRVKRRGVDVHARKGYWAPDAAETASAAAAAADEAPPDVTRALAALSMPHDGRAVDTWIGVSRGGPGLTRVTFAWEPRGGATARREPVRLAVTASDPDGRTLLDQELSGTLAAFEAPPGLLKLKVVARDAGGEVVDERVRDLTVPDLWSAPVTLGTPRILRARSGSDFRAMTASADPMPAAGRDFFRGDRLLIRFPVYHRDPAAPSLSARLLNRRGHSLTNLAVAPDATGAAGHQIDLPLVSLAQGDYVIRIEAQSGGSAAVELVPIRVR